MGYRNRFELAGFAGLRALLPYCLIWSALKFPDSFLAYRAGTIEGFQLGMHLLAPIFAGLMFFILPCLMATALLCVVMRPGYMLSGLAGFASAMPMTLASILFWPVIYSEPSGLSFRDVLPGILAANGMLVSVAVASALIGWWWQARSTRTAT